MPEELISSRGKYKLGKYGAVGWTSGDNRAEEWTYFWIEFYFELNPQFVATYSLFLDNNLIVEKVPLLKSAELFAKTNFQDDEPDDNSDSLLGGAEKLDAGIYELQFEVTIEDRAYLLKGIRFEVAAKDAEVGGWQLD